MTNDEVDEILDGGFAKMHDEAGEEIVVKFVIYDVECYESQNIDVYITDICQLKGEGE